MWDTGRVHFKFKLLSVRAQSKSHFCSTGPLCIHYAISIPQTLLPEYHIHFLLFPVYSYQTWHVCYMVPSQPPKLTLPAQTRTYSTPSAHRSHTLLPTAPQNQANTHLSHRIPDSSHAKQPSLYHQA